MKFACLVYIEENTMSALSMVEHKALDRENLAYDAQLKRDGHLIAAEALQRPAEGITVRVRNGKLSTTDGPFAETKEHLGGFLLIEARDLNEAVRLAGRSAMARLGCIEVRPIYDFKSKLEDES